MRLRSPRRAPSAMYCRPMTLLPTPEIPATTVVAAVEETAVDDRSSPGCRSDARSPGSKLDFPFAARRPRRLHPAIDLDPAAVDDPEGLCRPIWKSCPRDFTTSIERNAARLIVLDREPDHRVGDRLLGHRGASPPLVERDASTASMAVRLSRWKPCHQEMEDVSGRPARRARSRDDSVDEHPPRADRRRLLEEEAVRLLHLLLEDLARGEDDLQPVLALELRQVPAESRRVARQLVGRHLEQDDEAGLVELAGATIDELHAQSRLPGADAAFDQDDVAARDAAIEDAVEPGDPGLNQTAFQSWFQSCPSSQRRLPTIRVSRGRARPCPRAAAHARRAPAAARGALRGRGPGSATAPLPLRSRLRAPIGIERVARLGFCARSSSPSSIRRSSALPIWTGVYPSVCASRSLVEQRARMAPEKDQ